MVSKIIERARETARKHLESLQEAVCTVYTYSEAYDDKAHCMRTAKDILYEDMPCKVSFGNIAVPATESDTVTHLAQTVTLFVSPEYEIPAGSLVDVAGIIYEASGQPLTFPTHNEIGLVLAQKEA